MKRICSGILVALCLLAFPMLASADAFGTNPASPGTKNLLFVTNRNQPFPAGDLAIKTHMETGGWTVYVIDATSCTTAVAPLTPAGKQLIILSAATTAALLQTAGNYTSVYQSSTVPIISCANGARRDLNMVLAANLNQFATTTLNIINAGHPLAGGLSAGPHVITTVAPPGDQVRWGNPSVAATGAIKIATSGANQYSIFAYDTGGMMENGLAAPARRVGFWNSYTVDNTGANQGAAGWTADAWTLFDAAVTWASGLTVPVEVSAFNVD